MSKVRPHPIEDIAWIHVRDIDEEKLPEGLTEGERNSRMAYHEMGDDETLQLFEAAFEPGGAVPVHAHDEDEIIYILQGEMHLGDKVLRPGSSVFIAGNAFYSFKAGSRGVRFLNFRPKADYSYHVKGR